MGSHNQENEKPIILEPDHPLMQKFQITLKNFLEEENERTKIEILELSENLKKNQENYEKQMSHEMYNLEQEISQQRKQVSDYEEKLKFMEEFRTEKNLAIKEYRENFKDAFDQLNQDKNKDIQLINELDALTLLCKQYEDWEQDINSELAVNQRISEKSVQDKRSIIEEKKKMDIMIYKLTTDVWNLQSQINLIEDQAKIKSQELEDMKEHVANGVGDLQALHAEQQQLMQLWNSVVINIQQKDKTLAAINEEYRTAQNDLQTLVAHIEAIKKEIKDEKQKHEHLTMMKNKHLYDMASCSQMINVEDKKGKKFENSYININSALEATEKDLQLEKTEIFKKESILKKITLHYENLINKKISLENETLNKLQERLSSDKNVEDLAIKIRKLKDNTKKQELNMLTIENHYANIMLKIEKQKIFNSQKQEIVANEKSNFEKQQEELNITESRLKNMLWNIERQQNYLASINKKIEIALEKSEGIEISPLERKLESLETKISESILVAKELRQNWIRLQKYVINSTEQNHKKIEEIDIIQNKINILEHKSFKLKNFIIQQTKEKKSVQRLIDRELFRVEQLSKQQYQNKSNYSDLEAKYNDLTVEYMAKLKDAEMQVMTIQEDINNIENEKEQLAIQLQNLEKKIKYWQKMEIIAMETKEKVKEEKSSTGNIGRMKMEIHRMQVRHGQVSRTAARLATDLAQTVWRRAAAVTRARAYTNKSSAPRYAFSIKNKEKRADLRALNQEIEVNQNMIETLKNEKKILTKSIQEKEIIISTMENEISKFKQQIEECSLFKQKNLEKIVRNQRSAQHYALIVNGRIRVHSVKSEPSICAKYNKQTKINRQLINLVKSLFNELPENRIVLTRILNTLNVNSDEQNI